MSNDEPRRRAARSTSSASTLTPTLMFGANTIGIARAYPAIAAMPASSKPVVPTTAAVPACAQAARCASVPDGRVKSISTSQARTAASMSAMTCTPVDRPKRSPASAPIAGLFATSSAPASTKSIESSAASINAWPIRPPAPATVMRIVMPRSVLLPEHVEKALPEALVAIHVRRRQCLGTRGTIEVDDRLGHLVPFPARDLSVGEVDGEIAMLDDLSQPRELVDIVPSVGAERRRDERRSEQLLDLRLRHAHLELVDRVLRQVIALVDVDLVDTERAPRRCIAIGSGASREEHRNERERHYAKRGPRRGAGNHSKRYGNHPGKSLL